MRHYTGKLFVYNICSYFLCSWISLQPCCCFPRPLKLFWCIKNNDRTKLSLNSKQEKQIDTGLNEVPIFWMSTSNTGPCTYPVLPLTYQHRLITQLILRGWWSLAIFKLQLAEHFLIKTERNYIFRAQILSTWLSNRWVSGIDQTLPSTDCSSIFISLDFSPFTLLDPLNKEHRTVSIDVWPVSPD